MSKPIHPPMPPISITIKGFDKILTGLNPSFFSFIYLIRGFVCTSFFHQVDVSIIGCFGKIIQRCADQGDQYWPRTGLTVHRCSLPLLSQPLRSCLCLLTHVCDSPHSCHSCDAKYAEGSPP